MKNIQIIDGALNCTYDIFELEEDAFKQIFPNGQDIEFIEDLIERVGEEKMLQLVTPMWKSRVAKNKVSGIHGTLFYQLHFKKQYYPTKKANEFMSKI